VGDCQCPDVEAGAAARCSCVAAQRAVGDRQGATAAVVGASALASHVAAEGAVSDGQRSPVEDAATETGAVATDRAVDNGERRLILIVKPAAWRAGMPIPDREAGNRDVFT